MKTIPHFIHTYFGKQKAGRLRNQLARKASGAFALKCTFICLSFVISFLLARVLGATGYGVYAYAMSWATLLGQLTMLGTDTLLVRNVAAYQAQSAPGLMRGLLRWAHYTVAILSSGTALLAAGVIWMLSDRLDVQTLSALWIALFFLPLTALTGLRRATMQGLHHVVTGELPEMLIRPVSLILMIGGAYLLLGKNLSAIWAVGLNVLAAGIAFLIGTLFLRKILSQAVSKASPVYQIHMWMVSALQLMLYAAIHMIDGKTDILMLGTLKGASAVGVYHIVSRGSDMVSFILTAVNTALSPTIVSLYASGDMQRLQSVITRSARVVLFTSLPIGLALIVFGDRFLLLFGPDFTQGHAALAILCVGGLMNTACGSVGRLLIMTGHERFVMIATAISTTLNIVLNLVLIPRWNLVGAATATATSMILWNLLLVIGAHRSLGINSTILGKVSPRKRKS
jgi:O-antigen/teichoic acid export membrane protein